MKTGDLILLKEYKDINDLVGLVQSKEILINGSFQDDFKFLVAFNSENGESHTILEKAQKYTYLGKREDYLLNNQNIINLINDYLLLNPHDVSWLQKIQLIELYKKDNNIEYNIKRLKLLYKKLLPKKEDLSFMDI